MRHTPLSLDTVPAWVAACAYCRVEKVLPFLAQIAERDTQEMNALPEEVRDADFRFVSNTSSPTGAFQVRRVEMGEAVANVAVERTRHAIEISTRRRELGDVKTTTVLATLSWESKTHTCLLTIDRKTYTLGAAVEHILKPLFFPGPDEDGE